MAKPTRAGTGVGPLSELETLRAVVELLSEAIHLKDGRWVWIDKAGHVTQGEEGPKIGCLTCDATARHDAKEDVRQSKALLRSLLDTAPVMTAIVELVNDEMVYVSASGFYNREAAALPGRTTKEIGGSDFEEIAGILKSRLDEALATGRPVHFEYARRIGPEKRWLSASVSHIEGSPETAPRFALVVLDTTARKQANDEFQRYAKRLANLRRIEQAILTGRSPEKIAQAALPVLMQSASCAFMSIHSAGATPDEWVMLARVGEGPSTYQPGVQFHTDQIGRQDIEALRAGQDVVVADIDQLADPSPNIRLLRALGMRSYVRVPLVNHGTLVGCLNLCFHRPGPFDPEALAVAHEVADSLAVAIRHARMFQEIEAARQQQGQLSHRLIRSQEAERRWVAHELHDEIAQQLSALRLGLIVAQRNPGSAASTRGLKESCELVETMIRQVRELSLGLWPSALDDFGLVPGLRSYLGGLAGQSGLEVMLDVSETLTGRFSRDVETACFRVLQEGLSNVVQHASARRVRVSLRGDGGKLRLIVADDGSGFDATSGEAPAQRGASLGLVGMRERAMLAGGRLRVRSTPGKGTTIRAVFPIRESDDPAGPGQPGPL